VNYRYLYWRTRDRKNQPMWLHFSGLSWRKQVLPFLEAEAAIDDPEFADNHHYVLAMVELRGCVAVVATRFNPDKTPHGEMAGVYLYSLPISGGSQLFGHLRHINMGGDQCLSPCILSRELLDEAGLDRMWVEGGWRRRRQPSRACSASRPCGGVAAVAVASDAVGGARLSTNRDRSG
jgi:hypothetical protein